MKLDIIKNELKEHIGDFVQNEAKEFLIIILLTLNLDLWKNKEFHWKDLFGFLFELYQMELHC